MSTTELKLIYESLLDSGDLFDMFPNSNMTGDWSKDKNKFSKHYLDVTYLGDFEEDYEEDF